MMDLLRAWRYARVLDECRPQADAPSPATRGAGRGPARASAGMMGQAFVHDALRSPSLAPREAAPEGLAKAIISDIAVRPCAADMPPSGLSIAARTILGASLAAVVLGGVALMFHAQNGASSGVLGGPQGGPAGVGVAIAGASGAEAARGGSAALPGAVEIVPRSGGAVDRASADAYERELAAIRADTERAARALLNALPLPSADLPGADQPSVDAPTTPQ